MWVGVHPCDKSSCLCYSQCLEAPLQRGQSEMSLLSDHPFVKVELLGEKPSNMKMWRKSPRYLPKAAIVLVRDASERVSVTHVCDPGRRNPDEQQHNMIKKRKYIIKSLKRNKIQQTVVLKPKKSHRHRNGRRNHLNFVHLKELMSLISKFRRDHAHKSVFHRIISICCHSHITVLRSFFLAFLFNQW